jgi:[acyl-carrier-protein] S-malonyltransferase
MKLKYVFLFPGQNSRYPGMLDRLRAATPVADRLLRDASAVLGRDLAAHYRQDNPHIFAQNRDVQIGVFLANHIFARALEAEGIRPSASAGLSLGEYNHLVEIGALGFGSALRLLEARGAAFDAAPKGVLKSVFPCQESEVNEALKTGRAQGSVDISIHLGKKHFVLGGDADAVDAAVGWLENEAYAQSRVIDPQLPMHAQVFRPAAESFSAALKNAEWCAPHAPYLPNVDGEPTEKPSPAVFVDRLYRHVYTTVQWQRSVELLSRHYPDATFVEVGPKSVLRDLVSREYRALKTHHVDGESGIDVPSRRARAA